VNGHHSVGAGAVLGGVGAFMAARVALSQGRATIKAHPAPLHHPRPYG